MKPDNQPHKLTLERVKARSLEGKEGGTLEAWLGHMWAEHMGSICLVWCEALWHLTQLCERAVVHDACWALRRWWGVTAAVKPMLWLTADVFALPRVPSLPILYLGVLPHILYSSPCPRLNLKPLCSEKCNLVFSSYLILFGTIKKMISALFLYKILVVFS